jgi:hypothetical protein
VPPFLNALPFGLRLILREQRPEDSGDSKDHE